MRHYPAENFRFFQPLANSMAADDEKVSDPLSVVLSNPVKVHSSGKSQNASQSFYRPPLQRYSMTIDRFDDEIQQAFQGQTVTHVLRGLRTEKPF
jgi:hypothetical protein